MVKLQRLPGHDLLNEAAVLTHLAIAGVTGVPVLLSQGVWIPFSAIVIAPVGVSLLEVVKSKGPLGYIAAAKLFDMLVGTLKALFAVGVLHRDLCPANIVFAHDGQPILIDFGHASINRRENMVPKLVVFWMFCHTFV